LRNCKNSECGATYKPATHNQIYCSPECCRVATNRRIKQKYHENKARLSGSTRRCACGAALSRYNKSTVCSACKAKKESKILEEVVGYFDGIVIIKEAPGLSVHGD
jgi:hypothetical protein